MGISEEIMRALDYSSDIVVYTTVRGTIKYVNQRFVEKYGYTQREIKGKNPSVLNTGYHDVEFYENLWNTISHGETWNGVFRNKTKDGRLIWEKACINPVKYNGGEIVGYLAVKSDITKEIEMDAQHMEEHLFMEELFANAPVGIAICEPILDDNKELKDLLVIKANPTAGSIVGRLGLVGLTLNVILPGANTNKQRLKMMLQRKFSFEAHLEELGKHLRFRSFPFGQDHLCVFFYDVSHYKSTISALATSEERYFKLVEDAPALISRFDADGLLSYVNNQYCKVYGADQDELLGQNFLSRIPDNERDKVWNAIQKLTPEQAFSELEYRIETDSGETRWLHRLDRALLDADGKIFEYQSVGMDFTSIKRTEEALIRNRNHLDAIVNNSIVGIAVVDPDGQFSMVNSRMVEMFGYLSKDDLCTKTYLDVTHPTFVEASREKVNQLFKGEIDQYNMEEQYLRKNGEVFWGDIRVSTLRGTDGKVNQVVGMLTDISKRKLYEQELTKSEAKLKELNSTKDKLFSIIAHDVKNPFNAILGFSTLLRNNLEHYTEEQIKDFVGRILSASENVYKLLDDLLIWAKSQLGQMQVNSQYFRLISLFAESFESFGPLAENKNIELIDDVDSKLVVYADVDMLRFVVRNLIHNAIKFTKDGGKVECKSNVLNEEVVLSVKDTGIGIRPERLKVIFDVGEFMATSGTSDEKGTGLGLHLAKEMIETNGGRIEVKSEVGIGTEFLIYLPLNKE